MAGVLRRHRAMATTSYANMRFLLAVGSSSELRGSGCGRPRSTAGRGLVLSPLKQSRGGRCRVTSDELAGERMTSSERKLPMHPSHFLSLGSINFKEQWKKRKDDVFGVYTCIAHTFSDDCEAYGRSISECLRQAFLALNMLVAYIGVAVGFVSSIGAGVGFASSIGAGVASYVLYASRRVLSPTSIEAERLRAPIWKVASVYSGFLGT